MAAKHAFLQWRSRTAARREFCAAMCCAWTQLDYARRLRIEGNQSDADYVLNLVAASRRRASLAKAGAA